MTTRPFELIKTLQSFSVPFVIIGGHAVNSYGYARATEVTDIIFRRSEQSESALYETLKSLNAFWISNEIDPDTRIERTIPIDLHYVKRTRLMMLGTDLGYLDVFDFIPGLESTPVASAFENIHNVDGRPYICLDLLRRMKLASGRAKDLLDLENLPQG